MNDFDPAKVTQLLVDYGLKKQEGQGRDPLVTYTHAVTRLLTCHSSRGESSFHPVHLTTEFTAVHC